MSPTQRHIDRLGNFALGLVDDIVRPVETITHVRGHVLPRNEDAHRLPTVDFMIHHESGMQCGGRILSEDADILCALARALDIPLCSTLNEMFPPTNKS